MPEDQNHKVPCMRRSGGAVPSAENVGDLIPADHKVLSEGCESRNNHRYAVGGAQLGHPMDKIISVARQKLLRKHKGACKSSWSRTRIKLFTLTIPSNLKKPLKIFHGIIAHRHQTDRTDWKKVHLQHCCNQFWMKIDGQIEECQTHLRNVTDPLFDGKTPCEIRFGHSFQGPIIPFRSLVEHHPIIAKDHSRIHQFGLQVLPGLFLGCALYAEWIWKGDIWVADMHASTLKDAMQKKTYIEKERDNFFSCRKWTGQTFWKRFGTENTHLDAGAPNPRRKSSWFSWRIRRAKRWMIWSMSRNFIWRHHVEPRLKLYSPREKSLTHPELQEQIWTLCKNSASMIIGISMGPWGQRIQKDHSEWSPTRPATKQK